MPLVEITLIEGRPAAKKLALMREVTAAVASSIGAPAETIRVVIREVPPEHWAVGGVPKSAAAEAPPAG